MNKDGVTVGFPVHRYLSPSTPRGGPLRAETTRATEFKPQLGFHVFLSLYGSFSCVLPKAYLCNAFTQLRVFPQHLVVTMVRI